MLPLMVQLIEEEAVDLKETEKNKDGGNTPDPSANAAINNVVNGHASPTGSTSLVVDHSQAELTKVGFSLTIFFV